MRKRIILLNLYWILLFITSSNIVFADLQAGFEAFNNKNYPVANKEFRVLAERGSREAQYMLGVMYELGQGQPSIGLEAVKWYALAANNGLADAQTQLGFLYFRGFGVSQDYAKAYSWFRKSASQGEPKAQAAIGAMYAEGLGVPQNHREAEKWYLLAANQGDPFAQRNLGIMYSSGGGLPRNPVLAHMWINLAASKMKGQHRVELMAYREELESQMTQTQVAEAQRLASSFKARVTYRAIITTNQ